MEEGNDEVEEWRNWLNLSNEKIQFNKAGTTKTFQRSFYISIVWNKDWKAKTQFSFQMFFCGYLLLSLQEGVLRNDKIYRRRRAKYHFSTFRSYVIFSSRKVDSCAYKFWNWVGKLIKKIFPLSSEWSLENYKIAWLRFFYFFSSRLVFSRNHNVGIILRLKVIDWF